MNQLKAYKLRVYPTKDQEYILEKTFGCVRFVWNQRVESFNNWSPDRPQQKDLTIKQLKEQYEWLSEVPYNALEQKLLDWNQYKTQFFSKKRKIKVGRPSFKSKKTHRDSFRLSVNGFKFKEDQLVLGKIGVLKTKGYDLSRLPLESCKQVTISRNPSGQYFVSILVEEQVELKQRTGRSIGIDMGLKDLFIFSDGTVVDNPKWFRESQSKLKKAQKHLSRKSKGSTRYEKQRIKVAKIHQQISNQRQWFLHNLSTYLVNNYDEIIVEDLNVKGMVKNSKLSKSISDASWSTFVSMLSYKSNWYGRTFHKIDRFYPSSKTCSCCGHVVDKLPLSIRDWDCPSCNTHHDRDLNAAKNILSIGLNDLYGTSEEYSDYSRGDMVSLCEVHPHLAQSMKRLETL